MGKIYVCSDIHGHKELLDKALEHIGSDDTLYILGDVIDKGPDSIGTLRTVMNDPRCELLLGNHELMMLEYLACRKRYEQIGLAAGTGERFADICDVWLSMNGGAKTIRGFRDSTREEQRAILYYLKNSPIVKTLDIGDRKFCLVHAAVPFDIMEDEMHDIYLPEIKDERYAGLYDWRSDIVWGRYMSAVPGYTTITGHTASKDNDGGFSVSKVGQWYDIDCGLAYRRSTSRLALMCLNDMSIHYIDRQLIYPAKPSANNTAERVR